MGSAVCPEDFTSSMVGRREEAGAESAKAWKLGGWFDVGWAQLPAGLAAGRAQAQGEVPRRQGGRSHGNRRIPSVASDNLPCASGSLTTPPRCQAMLAESVLTSGEFR